MGRGFPRMFLVVQEGTINAVVEHGTLEEFRGVRPRHRSAAGEGSSEENNLLKEGGNKCSEGPGRADSIHKGHVARDEGLPRSRDREAPSQKVLAGVAAAPAEGAGAVWARGPVLQLADSPECGLRSGPLRSEASTCSSGEVTCGRPRCGGVMVGDTGGAPCAARVISRGGGPGEHYVRRRAARATSRVSGADRVGARSRLAVAPSGEEAQGVLPAKEGSRGLQNGPFTAVRDKPRAAG